MARDPNNIHRFIDYMEEVPERVSIPELDIFTIPDYDLNDQKDYKKYLFDIEKVVRGSFEYQQMVRFLRENLDMNQCTFFEAVSNIDTTSIKIEIHHEPLSLFDIVSTVVNKRTHFNESLEVEAVAKEVAYNHYAMSVGLIPLSETVHQLVHNQYLFIPNSIVFGNWRYFVDCYNDYIDPEVKIALEQIEELTNSGNYDDYRNILAKQYIYVDAGNSNPNLQDVQRSIKDRVNEIMNGNSKQIIMNQPKEERQYYYPITIDEE